MVLLCSVSSPCHPKCHCYTHSHWQGLQLGLAVGNVFKTCNSRETDAGGWEFKATVATGLVRGQSGLCEHLSQNNLKSGQMEQTSK